MKSFFILLLSFLSALQLFAQSTISLSDRFEGDVDEQIVFVAAPNQAFGFDNFNFKTSDEYTKVLNGYDPFKYVVPVKSIGEGKKDVVRAQLIGDFSLKSSLKFIIENETNALTFSFVNDSLVEIELPARDFNYTCLAIYDNEIYGALDVLIYEKQFYKITLIPTTPIAFSPIELKNRLYNVFKTANIQVAIDVYDPFVQASFNGNTVYKNPDTQSYLRYTDQLTQLTRAFEASEGFSPTEYKVFMVSNFEDTTLTGFMGMGNKTGFVKMQNEASMTQSIVEQLFHGIAQGTNLHPQLFDDSLQRFVLSHADWEAFRNGASTVSTQVANSKGARISALTAYYAWIEEKDGAIQQKSFTRLFKKNSEVVTLDKIQRNGISEEQISKAIAVLIADKSSKSANKFSYTNAKGAMVTVDIPLKKSDAQDMTSILFRKQNGSWIAERMKKVIYVNILQNDKRYFSHSSDSISLSVYNLKIAANNHYMVKTFWNTDGSIKDQEVVAFTGEDVTKYLIKNAKSVPQRYLVFANGYRGPQYEKDVSDNMVAAFDRYHYWSGIDGMFVNRLKPYQTYYIDGSHGISTSGHKSMANFALSMSMAKTLSTTDYYSVLNRKPNVEGFNERKDKGMIAGKSFLLAKCNSPACMETRDTVDVVCHSMGYAYTIGFLEAIKDYVVFGKIYIIAPENACSGGFDWQRFQEVWQYGSNLDQPNPDPVWEQDGVAPQCAVKGIEKVNATNGGRIFIPKDWPKKGFVESHMLYNYKWIFDRIKPGDPGYVKSRN